MKTAVFLAWAGMFIFFIPIEAQTKSAPIVNVVEKNAEKTSVELGQVSWNRDLEKALKKSASSGKPVLVLFQEVPG